MVSLATNHHSYPAKRLSFYLSLGYTIRIYNNGITVLNTDKPIATFKVSKIDFATGAETPLGVSTAVITQDGPLSFTHARSDRW